MVKPLTCELQATYEQSMALKENLEEFLAGGRQAIPAQAGYDIWLAVHETFINIVEHAYENQGGRVICTAAWREPERAIEISLWDHGRSFSPDDPVCPDPTLLQEGGYGLYLVRRLMDRVTYTPGPQGNCWQLLKYLPAS